MKALLLLSLGLALAAPAVAQCATVTFGTYGNTCLYFNQAATLTGQHDPTTCTVALTLTKSGTCCNTFPRTQILMLGLNSISPPIAHRLLVPGCTVAVLPDVVLVQAASAGGVWKLPAFGVPPGLVVYAQGINEYFTTIGLYSDWQTSDGLKIAFS